jgi:hypothetical protein
MFEQSFTLSVPTDAEGRFHSSQPVSSPFSLDIKITAALQSPDRVQVHGFFSLKNEEVSDAEPVRFSMKSGETANLGKWRAIEGDDANIATAEGSTEPPAANAEIIVLFTAAPSFF